MGDTLDYKRRLLSSDLVFSDISLGEKYTLIDGSDLKKGQSISSVVKKASSSLSDDQCLIVFVDNPLGLQYLLGYRDDEGLIPFSTFADDDGKRRMDYEGLSVLKKGADRSGFCLLLLSLSQQEKLHPFVFRQRASRGEGAQSKEFIDR